MSYNKYIQVGNMPYKILEDKLFPACHHHRNTSSCVFWNEEK